jgi:tetratricopeptide (TPR) repeat protein
MSRNLTEKMEIKKTEYPLFKMTDILLIFAVAIGIRFANLVLIDDNPYFHNPVMDEFYHDDWAEEIAQGNLFDRAPFYRAPAYPVLLGIQYSIFGNDLFTARFINSIIGSLNCILVYLLAGILFNRKTALLAGFAACFYGMLIYFDASLLSVPLEIFLVLSGVIMLLTAIEKENNSIWFACGIIFALGVITRPTVIVFLPVVLLASFGNSNHYKRKFSPLMSVILGCTIPVGLVYIINCIHGDSAVIVAWNGGINLYLGNNDMANGWSATSPLLRGAWFSGYQDAITIAEEASGHSLSYAGVSNYWMKQGLSYISGDFVSWIGLMFRKGYLLISNVEIPNNQSIDYIKNLSLFMKIPLFKYGVVFSLAVPGIIFASSASGKGKFPGKLFVTKMCILLYGFAVILFFVNARYRMPIIPFLIIFASYSAIEVVRSFMENRWKVFFKLTGTACAAAFLSFSSFSNSDFSTSSQTHYSLGNQFFSQGEMSRAISEYEMSIQMAPSNLDAWNNLASAYAQTGDYQSAHAALLTSIESCDNPTAHARMGLLFVRQERYMEAEQHLEIALTDNPGDVESLYYLASLRAQTGQEEEALLLLDRALSNPIDPRLEEQLNYLKGRILYNLGRVNLAIGALENAPNLPEAQALLLEMR